MRRVFWVAVLFAAGALFARDLGPETVSEAGGLSRTAVTQPVTDEKTHHVGSLYLTVSNWGFFGSQRGEDNPYYCIIDDEGICGQTGVCRPSGEYPGCSGIEYLFQGALWIGAVIAGDTLVSVGEDGWQSGINELLPSYNYDDTLVHRSILEGDSAAVSEEDYVGNFADTITNTAFVDPSHRPIGVAVHQESYAWSYDYAKNFVIIDYTFKNVRTDGKTISDMYIGIYVDGDCGHVQTPDYAQDDITGFIENYIDWSRGEPDTIPIMLAWIADNDGDPEDGMYTDRSPTGAMAVRVLRGPWGTCLDSASFSYNWWISNIDETYDWGPAKQDLGFDGTPEGDINKYKVMSNGEFDYDQTEIEDYKDDPNWQGNPPPDDENWIRNLSNGYDTRFLLSFGPLTLAPGDTAHITIAFLVGENFHTNPQNVEGPTWQPDFNFDDLAYAAYWVALIFDNPGVDTDGDGYAGEFEVTGEGDTIWLSGDGVPDYKGPAPPSAPEVKVVTGENKVTVFWKKDPNIEEGVDQITGVRDFEGYRIYIAEANLDQYYTPIKQFDKIDFLRCLKLVELYTVDDTTGDTTYYYQAVYSDEAIYSDTAYTVPILSPAGDTLRDTTLVPTPIFENLGMPPETLVQFEDDPEPTTYYYYTIENLLPGDDKYIAVTTFDYGQPSRNLGSLESSKTKYAKWVVPTGAAAKDNRVRVVPNPYRVDHDYSDFWEYSYTGEWSEYSRKLRFFNLPPRCKIRIYTLDGDLVQTLYHDDNAPGKMVGAEDWNLISRNDQAIASGIYIFSVENLDTGEIQTGKFVIIK